MTTRFRGASLAALVTLAVVASACGLQPDPTRSSAPRGAAKATILPIPITSAFRVGDNRIVFTLTDSSGQKQVAAPDRSLSIGYRGPKGETIAPAPQSFIWAIEGVNGVYVGHATFPSAGQWTADFTTRAPGATAETTTFGFDVRDRVEVISPGDPAPSVKTPTIADFGGDVSKVSSDATPIRRFYETSEADALAAKKPFVLIFATPKFCQSATCGPTLDRLKPVAAAHPELTIINVEPYQLAFENGGLRPVMTGQDLTPVEATLAFKLQSEPYIFVIGADGKVGASFELVFSADEIEAAIKAVETPG
ncbi:MAG: hypothetical protein H0V73_12115 [Chloroflexi bacterium]|nr:hypothetical protein [Chloroflexota bacterium]